MIIGIFEGELNGQNWHLQVLRGDQSGKVFSTIRKDGKFHHKDNWNGDDQSTVNACQDKCEIWKTPYEKTGSGFMSVRGTFDEKNGRIVQDNRNV